MEHLDVNVLLQLASFSCLPLWGNTFLMELDFGKPVPGSVRQGAQTSQWHFYHFCCFTSQVWKGDRDPFSQFPAHQGRAKAAESRQGLL